MDNPIKRALLIANGEVGPREAEFVKDLKVDLVVAADGGAHNALFFGIRPDIVVGDFDSVTDATRETLKGITWIHRPSQEYNDLEKALIYCREQKICHVTLVGFTGKRLDHTLGNLSVLMRYDAVFKLDLKAPDADLFLVRDHLELQGIPGQHVSLVPLGRVEGLTTRGLKYPLHCEDLEFGKREGTSNQVMEGTFSVSLTSGVLLLVCLAGEL